MLKMELLRLLLPISVARLSKCSKWGLESFPTAFDAGQRFALRGQGPKILKMELLMLLWLISAARHPKCSKLPRSAGRLPKCSKWSF